jgi:amidophosphoribosyltransferase
MPAGVSFVSSREVRHHCGLFGVWGHEQASLVTHLGLYAQQHRGQESAGICTTDGSQMRRHVGMGLVNEVFTQATLERINLPNAIGHVRYSTSGSSCETNAQPLSFQFAGGQVALAHNGTLTNARDLRYECEQRGQIFQSTSDTEVIVHLLAEKACREDPNGLPRVLGRLEGAYSLLFLFLDRIVAVRDPMGFRPLCIGRAPSGSIVVASETCALDILDAEYIRDVEPGEILTIDASGMHSERFGPASPSRGGACIFEHVYFADPASNIFGENVHRVRERTGRMLAKEAPVDADLVIPIPNCARCAAIGYAAESGLTLGRGFTTSHYAGRSFIMPDQLQRDLAVKLKLNVIKDAVRGKRLVVVEDSVVRGTTTRGKLEALRKAGATEIHLRVASPPLRYACFHGIDFPDPQKLVATNRDVRQIAEFLGVDSLHYLSLDALLRCVKGDPQQYCTACFSGDYPVTVSVGLLAGGKSAVSDSVRTQ